MCMKIIQLFYFVLNFRYDSFVEACPQWKIIIQVFVAIYNCLCNWKFKHGTSKTLFSIFDTRWTFHWIHYEREQRLHDNITAQKMKFSISKTLSPKIYVYSLRFPSFILWFTWICIRCTVKSFSNSFVVKKFYIRLCQIKIR